MTDAIVRVSMRAENGLNCSFATLHKGEYAVLILLRDAECAIFDLHDPQSRYLLLKHYPDDQSALTDFYKLIGKMCAKPAHSKYFGTRLDEINHMAVLSGGGEHMLTPEEAPVYAKRMAEFLAFAQSIRNQLHPA